MTQHIAGGRTILFAPTVPADDGLHRIVGSIDRTAQVDIVVGADGAIMKDRHGDADTVLANLAADTDTRLAAEGLEWEVAAKAVYMYAVGQLAVWWGTRRVVRKAGAPGWAVKMSGRLALLIGAPQSQKASGLDKELIERISHKAAQELTPKVIGLVEGWKARQS